MAAHHNLSEYQFRYRPTGPQVDFPGYDNTRDEDEWDENKWTLYDHEVYAVHKPTNSRVGEMFYHTDGPIFQIDVDEEHKRKGIATEMVNHATRVAKASNKKIRPPSRAYTETDEGSDWADSMVKRGLMEE
jgi:GNAT superfamily N-acetyltransferase